MAEPQASSEQAGSEQAGSEQAGSEQAGSEEDVSAQAAYCADGSLPQLEAEETFSCEDGSEPRCEAGSSMTLSADGSTLLCDPSAGPEAPPMAACETSACEEPVEGED